MDGATRATQSGSGKLSSRNASRSLGCKNSLATAISQAQEAMGGEGNQWYRPVLYLRWEDNEGGQLFKSAPVESDTVQTQPPLGVQPPGPQPPPINPKTEFYKKRLAAKEEELIAIEAQLKVNLSKKDELKLTRDAEMLIEEIDDIRRKIA